MARLAWRGRSSNARGGHEGVGSARRLGAM